ncbi:helix-turn-helix transcriptional regulator [Undibacterium sp. BYS50W]|nr:helix-turn-helix transcriptional regulator [Undibacterium rugosum]
MSALELEIQLRTRGYSLGHFMHLVDYPTLCDLTIGLATGVGDMNTCNTFLTKAIVDTASGSTVISAPDFKYSNLKEQLFCEKKTVAILSSVTCKVMPLIADEDQYEVNEKLLDIQCNAKAAFSINKNKINPLNKMAQLLLDDLNKSDFQSLQDHLLGFSGNSNSTSYCIEAGSPEKDTSNFVVRLIPQEVGSSAWLQYKFSLTAREGDVCYLMLQGHGDKVIAKLLNISYWTVRTHVANILKKIGITSRNEIGIAVLKTTFSFRPYNQ